MSTKPISLPNADALRQLAEAKLRKRNKKPAAKSATGKANVDTQRLLHELQVHQVELEMQNAELQEARDGMESLLGKYTDLYDFAPVGYFTLTAKGRIQLVNLTGATLLGVDRSRLVGQSLGLLIQLEQRPAFDAFMKLVFADPAKQECDFELTSRGLPLKIVKVRAQRSPNEDECSAVLVDITERQLAEDKVHVSEIRYRRLFEAAHDGVLLLDPNTRKITDANPFMTKLLGYSHDQLVGKELFEIGLLKDEADSQEMVRKLKRNHEVRYEDLPLKSKTGRHQEVEVVANLYQENQRAVIQCNIRDITVRKQAEDAVRRSQVLFYTLIEQAPVGVYVVDAEFRMQQVNALARPVFKNAEPLISRDFAEVLYVIWSKRVADQIAARFRHTLKTGAPYQSAEFNERRRDIDVKEVYEWQIQRVTLPDGKHSVVCFFNNITERKRAEWVRRRLDVLTASNAKLELEIIQRQMVEKSLKKSEQHQGQMLKKSQLLQQQLRSLSHQILHAQEEERKRISRELHDVIAQTLVGINVHLATLAQGDAGTPGLLQQKLAHTQRLVEQATDTVHQFARELRPSVLDDLGLVPALESFFTGFTESTGVRVCLHVFAGLEAAIGTRRTVLYRIAQEALTNVARHAKASLVEVNIKKRKEVICMEIKDNGQGFKVDDNSSAKRTKRLGMIGMKERIEMVGGSFRVESALGKSTTVHVEISAHHKTMNKNSKSPPLRRP